MSSEQITIPHNFIPRPYQLEVFKEMDGIIGKPDSRKRRALLRWHRRAGKDKCCWCYMIKEAAQVPGNYFYVFPTKTMARQALWENVDSSGFKLLDHIPKEFITRRSNQEMLLELNNGSTLRVLGYDKDPDSIRGIACKGVVFSEFAFSDPESYKTMIPALRESEGWAIFNSTPNGRNHFYDLWQSVFRSERWFASLLQTYWPDKPGYSGLIKPALFEEIRHEEGLTEEDVEREYGCAFNTGMKGAIYSDELEAAFKSKRIGTYIYEENVLVNTYWDIGISDSDVCWFAQQSGNAITMIDYFDDSGLGTDQLAIMLKNKGYKYDTHYLPHDAGHRIKGQSVKTIAEHLEESLKKYGVTGVVDVLPKTSSVQTSITNVRKMFPRVRMDHENCNVGITHLELYHRRYDKRRKTFLKDPHHDEHSHAADAFRMVAESLDILPDPTRPKEIKAILEYDIFE